MALSCKHNFKNDSLCVECTKKKPYTQFKYCKLQCLNCNECGYFWGNGAPDDLVGRPINHAKRIERVPYTSANIKTHPSWINYKDIWYSKLTGGRPIHWSCDQRTVETFLLSQWLLHMLKLNGASEDDRHRQLWFWNRKSRAEDDLFAIAALTINNFLDGNIDHYTGK